jgi:hypothetical protein
MKRIGRSGQNRPESIGPLESARSLASIITRSIPRDRSRSLAELCHARSPPERENAIGPTELLRATL